MKFENTVELRYNVPQHTDKIATLYPRFSAKGHFRFHSTMPCIFTQQTCPNFTNDPLDTLEITWSPFVIKDREFYKVTFNYTGAVTEIDDIYVCFKIWLKDLEDPIFDDCQSHTCSSALAVLQMFIKNAKCPLLLSLFFSNLRCKHVFVDVVMMRERMGDYIVRIEMSNAKGRTPFFCIEGDVSVEDV
ncbi:hypothetical protein HELRODRAFT_162509 [Helobdella robusta]|uniref:Uncharacterized protein n=1 Tax=Helobdella robusta TaxID=6412 RepID=T1ESR9_HELRO|nr:hypothetical protein HELRODRAFT_162509 [Helobdella robusta]ESN99031.1 hypothetical protein HELRODRAFT_162509 [Helobdella robusta]